MAVQFNGCTWCYPQAEQWLADSTEPHFVRPQQLQARLCRSTPEEAGTVETAHRLALFTEDPSITFVICVHII